MANIEKKKAKLKERIDYLDRQLRESLTKKSSDTKEVNVGELMSKINELRKMYSELK